MTKNARTVQAVVLLALITFSTATGIALTSRSAGCLAANPPSSDSGTASPEDDDEDSPPGPVLAPNIPEIGLAAFKGEVENVRRLIASGTSTEIAGKTSAHRCCWRLLVDT